jgi:hypothetical protein
LVAFGAPGRDVSVARSFPCATDADCANPNECATKTCDALDPNADPSGCVYGAVPEATPCSDDDACTSGDACTSDICISGGPVVCARCEICTTLDGCIVAPQSGCQQAAQAPYPSPLRRSKLLLRSKENDNADQVKWTFRGGKSRNFGDPMNTTDFTLCVYDAGGSDLLFSAAAPAGDQCAGRDCWVPAGNGFKYRDRELTPDGIVRITLKKPAASAPLDAQSRISLAGRGGSPCPWMLRSRSKFSSGRRMRAAGMPASRPWECDATSPRSSTDPLPQAGRSSRRPRLA